MSLNPDVQKKAQEEVDRVVGPRRLPNFEDYDRLVYVKATILETLRWLPVLPMGVPHVVTHDDEYKGFFIPKDATIIPVSRPLACIIELKLKFRYRRIYGKSLFLCSGSDTIDLHQMVQGYAA